MTESQGERGSVGSQQLTFVIADVRGYTRFTRERGDAAAAELARRFAEIGRDCVEARSGRVIELRGDEVLAVFTSPAQAVRAAVELQLACAEETDADPAFPFLVGVGIDTGAAVPVEDGYRGVALNLAARLCSAAGAGQVLLSTRTLSAADLAPDRVRIEAREPMVFKGFDDPVDVFEATAVTAAVPPRGERQTAAATTAATVDELPMVGRVGELRWLRGTWRQARRGNGRVVAVSGSEGIGKTRLALALASFVESSDGTARVLSGGGTAAASALAALREARHATSPSLLVVDDVDAIATELVTPLEEAWADLEHAPVMVVLLVRDVTAVAALADVVARADADGDGRRDLAPLPADEVREVVALYAGAAVTDAPVESIVRSSHGVPARIHELASEWARSEATRRLEAAAEFMAAVRERRTEDLDFANNVIGLRLGRLFDTGPTLVGGGEDVQCPYKGLASFEENDAAWFFGRERLVGELAARLVGNGLLAVVGGSGSGKSSVVAAGLLPSLASGLLPGSERWTARTMRPGEQPVEAARAALGTDADDPLGATVAGFGPQDRLVFVVDQFEELFTTCASEPVRQEFVDMLARAATADAERCVVVVTVRSDFYGHIATYPQIASLFRDNHVLVGPLSRDELHRAITLPARRAGVHVEAALADALVDEAAGEPGSLPLLSTALVELWQARTDRWLRMPSYRETGGIQGAVARLAEASYAELSEVERDAARRVMLRLGVSGEGDVLVRRRVRLDEFDLDRDDAARRAIERFTQDRLLTTEADTVEVAHEALLRDWPRLGQWLGDDLQGRQLRQHVIQAARAWDAAGRDSSELYRGLRLTATLDWAASHAGDLNELEREFLAASRQEADREVSRQRRTNRRLRTLLSGVAVLLVLALIAGGLALAQRSSARSSARHARQQATNALAQSLGAQAVAQPRIDLAMLLAREAVALSPTLQTRVDLLTTLMRVPSALHTYHFNDERNSSVLLSPDGKTLAIADNNGNWIWRDTTTGREIRENRDNLVAFAPDGTIIDAGSNASFVFRDPGTYRVTHRITAPRFTHSGAPAGPLPNSSTSELAWSAGVVGFANHNRTLLASFTRSCDYGIGPQTLIERVVPIAIATGHEGRVKTVVAGPGTCPASGANLPTVNGLIPMRDGTQLLVVAADQAPVDQSPIYHTSIVDTGTGKTVRRFPTGIGGDGVAVSPDARTVALARQDGQLQFLDLATGGVQPGIGAVNAAGMQFTPDGKTLVVIGQDGVVQLWDVASRTIAKTLTGHAGAIHGMAISRDGKTLYTGSFDTNVIGWDLAGTRGLVRSFSGGDADPAAGAWTLAVAPDNRTIAEGAANGDVVLTDLTTGRELKRFHAVDGGIVSAVSFSPDGRSLLVSADSPGQYTSKTKTWLEIWALSPQPHVVRQFDTSGWPFISWSAWSPDGRTVATTGFLDDQNSRDAGAVGEWNAATGRPLAPPLRIKGGYSVVVAFAPHGTDVAVGGAFSIDSFIANPAAGKVLVTLKGSNSTGELGQGLAYSPDGTKVATAQWDGTIRIWDARTGRQLAKISDLGQDVVEGVAWSPDGRTLAVTDWDPSLRLYDVATHQQIGPAYPLPTLPDPLQYDPWVQFTPDGRDVVVTGANDQTFVMPVTLAGWSKQACNVAGRSFTRAEWAKYLPGRPYQPVCPNPPA